MDLHQRELERITAEFETAAGPFLRADRALAVTTATDESRTVSVTLDRHGRFSRVDVGGGWPERVGTEGLGPAVVAAYRAAVLARTEAWGADLGREAEGERLDAGVPAAPSVPLSPVPAALQTALESTPSPDEAAFVNGLLAYLEDAEAAFDEALAELNSLATTRVVARSGSGHVIATMSAAGELESVEYDEGWVANAHPFNVSRETVEAVTEAGHLAATRSATPARRQLTALGQDPATVLGYLIKEK